MEGCRMDSDRRPHVVIVGGGFAGLYAARALRKAPVRLTVIDRRNHHVFQPLLYQVATAALNPSDIAAPIRGVLGKHGVTVLLGDVQCVDVQDRRLLLKDGVIRYDYLILATGATHSYFGHDEWAEHAPGLKTLEDALEIRRRVLLVFEAAEREPDPRVRQELLTFAIIGAGPTGVEMAGAFAEIARQALARDFQHFDPRQARILLFEGVGKVLPPYPDRLSEDARRSLERRGIEVHTGAKVTDVEAHGLRVGDEWIPARTIIWAAGVAASPIARWLGVPLDRAGRVLVTPFLTVPGHDEIFVVGDLAHVEQEGQLVPGVAPAAMQMGKHAARNVLEQIRGAPMMPFDFWDRGTFAVIGRGSAVGVAFRRFQMKGVLAWFAWLFIHLMFLIGFRNRLVVLVNWAYSYVTFRRAVRLITGESPPLVSTISESVACPPLAGATDDREASRAPAPAPPH
jgi:NADH:ubiquinone reductase (H+-translocating)